LEKSKKLRICLVASAGGHLSQLLKLAHCWCEHQTFCVTTANVAGAKLGSTGRVYVVGECNREHPIRVLLVLVRCLSIMLREKPDVVLSTGAAAGCILCFIGKLMRAKIVWLDSITNVRNVSLSGRMVRYIADLFLVQWPHLAQEYKSAEYVGAVV